LMTPTITEAQYINTRALVGSIWSASTWRKILARAARTLSAVFKRRTAGTPTPYSETLDRKGPRPVLWGTGAWG